MLGEGEDVCFGRRSDLGLGFGFGSGGIPAAGGIGFLHSSVGWSRGFVGLSAGGCSAGRGCCSAGLDCVSAVAVGTGLGLETRTALGRCPGSDSQGCRCQLGFGSERSIY